MADEHKLRVGIVGGGWPGQRHAEGFLASGLWDIVAVADLDPVRRAELARGTRAIALATAQELFARDDLDAAIIALPTYLHHRMVVAALEAGKHVLCEKPPALNADETRAMAEAAERRGRVLTFGLQRRGMPSAAAAKTVVDDGELGQIYHANALYTRAWGAPRGHGNWFRNPATAGGGPLIDIGIHVLDLAWWLMGRPRPVSAFAVTHDRSPETVPLENAAFGLLRFEGNRSIQLEAAWILPQAEDRLCVDLYGTAAGARVEADTLTITRVGKTGIEQTKPPILAGWPDAFVAPFRTQASQFAAAIRGAGPPLTPAEDAVQLMRMVDALYASASTRHETSLTLR